MTNNEAPRTDWPFGPFLSTAIQQSRMSKRAIARAANISEGRLRQLETGYQKAGDLRIPVTTTPLTVINLANVLGFDLVKGLTLAGLEDAIQKPEYGGGDASGPSPAVRRKNPQLANYGTGQLMDEIAARYDELHRMAYPEGPVSVTVSGYGGTGDGSAVVHTDDEKIRKLSDRRPTLAELKDLDSAAEPERQDKGQTDGEDT